MSPRIMIKGHTLNSGSIVDYIFELAADDMINKYRNTNEPIH